MVYLFVLAVGFLIGVGSVCFLLAFMERDTRRAGDVIDLHETLVRIAGTPTKNSSDDAKDMARAANDVIDLTGMRYDKIGTTRRPAR